MCIWLRSVISAPKLASAARQSVFMYKQMQEKEQILYQKMVVPICIIEGENLQIVFLNQDIDKQSSVLRSKTHDLKLNINH